MTAKRRSDEVELHAVVDRIEDGGMAVLALGDKESVTIDFPVTLLPEGVGGGDHLRLRISLDDASRGQAEDRTRALLDELQSRSKSTGKKDFKL
jgi:hypothetical protein